MAQDPARIIRRFAWLLLIGGTAAASFGAVPLLCGAHDDSAHTGRTITVAGMAAAALALLIDYLATRGERRRQRGGRGFDALPPCPR